jgi:hypothetical protein
VNLLILVNYRFHDLHSLSCRFGMSISTMNRWRGLGGLSGTRGSKGGHCGLHIDYLRHLIRKPSGQAISNSDKNRRMKTVVRLVSCCWRVSMCRRRSSQPPDRPVGAGGSTAICGPYTVRQRPCVSWAAWKVQNIAIERRYASHYLVLKSRICHGPPSR